MGKAGSLFNQFKKAEFEINLASQCCRYKSSFGGAHRKKSFGRGIRPLSKSKPIHLVLKISKERVRGKSLRCPRVSKIIRETIERYSRKFGIKVSHLSIQRDHIHCLIRLRKFGNFHSFFRVVPGQISQTLINEKLSISSTRERNQNHWKLRPFTRIITTSRGRYIVELYISLNELEALGIFTYSVKRLRGLSSYQWRFLKAYHRNWT